MVGAGINLSKCLKKIIQSDISGTHHKKTRCDKITGNDKQKAEETGDDSSLFAIKGETGEVHDYLIDLGLLHWKLVVVDGYTESLKVSEGATCLHIGNFANVISAS